ncbi:MAG: dihydrodipicolinate synthase family protein [Rubripirellula sp.]|nr:dihydrodipicolinate synthase family protein [Rubripirellula sp.]
MDSSLQAQLQEGTVIPASPLALTEDRQWSSLHQRALMRYYYDAGAGGIAVGVHTTQFAIREHNLYEPVLSCVAETIKQRQKTNRRTFLQIAGICGDTRQASEEAHFAKSIGYHAGLLTTNIIREKSESEILTHCHTIADIIPVFGFYLHPAAGGRLYSHQFWLDFCNIPNVVAIKIAAFNRYQTLDVVRAVIASGRDDIALYTGNDDNIINDLLTPFHFEGQQRWIVGGLLGQWAVWTQQAAAMLEQIKQVRHQHTIPSHWLTANASLTDANAAIFDAAHGFSGCVPGVNEMLRRVGLLPSNRCLDPTETLSPGQSSELDRVTADQKTDDLFISQNLDGWLTGN